MTCAYCGGDATDRPAPHYACCSSCYQEFYGKKQRQHRRGSWRSPHAWRWINLTLALAWLAIIPLALATGWIYSIAFISAASIYANAVSHIAAYRADEPSDQ